MGEDGEVNGDFERSLKDFFSSAAERKDADICEAYMADFADVAEHGVPDPACRRTLVGQAVLSRMARALEKSGLRSRYVPESHEFRFGNAGTLRSRVSALIPVCLGGKQLAIRAAVLPGSGSETPLLLSKELLRRLQVKLDMGKDELEIGLYGVKISLKETERGHYAIPLFAGFSGDTKKKVMQNVQVETLDVNAAECSVKDRQISGSKESERLSCNELPRASGAGCSDGGLPEDLTDQRAHDGSGGTRERRDVGPAREDSGRGSRSQRRRARRQRARGRWHVGKGDIQCGEVPEARGPHEFQDGLRAGQEVRVVGQKIHQGQVRSGCWENLPPNHDTVSAICRSTRPTKICEDPAGTRALKPGGTSVEQPSATDEDAAKGEGGDNGDEGRHQVIRRAVRALR